MCAAILTNQNRIFVYILNSLIHYIVHGLYIFCHFTHQYDCMWQVNTHIVQIHYIVCVNSNDTNVVLQLLRMLVCVLGQSVCKYLLTLSSQYLVNIRVTFTKH